jgi:hypothetical protein
LNGRTTVSQPIVLVHLARLKLRGLVRKHVRRLRTPAGFVFGLVGIGLVCSWILSMGLSRIASSTAFSADIRPEYARLLLLGLVVMNVFAHVAQRGLFLQPAELDRLLSAPVPRSAVLGHRLLCAFGRAAVGAVLLGAVASFRVPSALGAFLGALDFTIALTLLGQAVSLAAALLERRLGERTLEYAAKTGIGLFVAAALALVVVPLPSVMGIELVEVARHPVVAALALPLEPLVDTFTAPNAAEAAIVGVPLLLALLVGFEVLRRWSVDWREIAITTSGRIGARLDRARRLGTGASGMAVSKWAARRRVPWLFGHTPVGAVVWRKSASILRRARVTLVFAGLTMLMGVGGLSGMSRGMGADAGWATVFLVVFGGIYLSGTLRFDLREEVDRLQELKAWPLASQRLFLALLLPQLVVVGGFLMAGVLILALLGSGALWPVALAAAFLPVFLLGWVATDNLFFLLWPVRIVPGADGMLQDVGRASILFLCRGLAAGLALGLALTAGFVVWELQAESSDVARRALVSAPAAWLVLALWSLLAVRGGGRALARFDPARVPG